MTLLHLDDLTLGDIINVPHVGLVRLRRISPNIGRDNLRYGTRYYFSGLDNNDDRTVVSIPDSGCYGPYLFFSPFETLETLQLGE